MKEIRLSIPEGCKAVTVKVDGGEVITEFEPKEKFKPEDGDIVTDTKWGVPSTVIYAGTDKSGGIISYAGLGRNVLTTEKGKGWGRTENYHPATEEEKQRLLDALAKEGCRWNPEKKELERLPRWRAERLRGYFFISEDTLEVKFEKEVFDEVDDARYEAMNYFKTEEAANRVAVQIREIFKNSKAE